MDFWKLLDILVLVYWANNFCKDWSTPGDHNTKFCVTERLEQLLKPKQIHKDYLADRPTPIWTVSKVAMKANPTPRIESLATAKPQPNGFQPRRSVYTVVSHAALNASASERVEKLAEPKVRWCEIFMVYDLSVCLSVSPPNFRQ